MVSPDVHQNFIFIQLQKSLNHLIGPRSVINDVSQQHHMVHGIQICAVQYSVKRCQVRMNVG